jgi:hypothetical protein
VTIGERRKPDPQGRPGYLRIDTVHQGDQDGVKGLYHINAIDEVTQWEVAGATAFISEAWLLPVLEAMLAQFPFHIRGFHSDNGSEFINAKVAGLLNKLLIEQTKSRPRRSNDNGLAETKNGWVIRKHIGYGHIASEHAEDFDQFYRAHFNPYLNFHRPCGVPEIMTSLKGKQKRVYRWYATPWEILRQVPDLAHSLRPDITIEHCSNRHNKNPTRRPHAKCSKPNASCSPACHESAAHESRGNAGPWKARKTKSRFPSLPTALGNRWRDSHLPTALGFYSYPIQKGAPSADRFAPAFRLIVR